MARKTKKEKHISIRKNGYEIAINRKNCKFSKFVSFADFNGDEKAALEYAKRIRDEKIAQINSGYSISSQETIKNLYLESEELSGNKAKTGDRHMNIYRQSIQKIEHKKITDIKASDIQRMLNNYSKTHSHDQTRRLLGLWKDLYKTAHLKGLRIFNEAELCRVPKHCAAPSTRECEIVTDNEYQLFMDCLHEYGATLEEIYRSRSIYYAVEMLRFTGGRPAEIFALTVKDINLKKGSISINKALSTDESGSVVADSTKTEKSIRKIPITEAMKPVLETVIERRKNEYLFTDFSGGLLPINHVCDLIRHVQIKTGIHFTMYSLRHRFAKQAIESGIPINHVRDILGHDSESMSIYYAVTSEEDKLDAITKINREEKKLS